LDTAAKRQARSAPTIQRRRYLDLSHAEGPVWHAASPDNWFVQSLLRLAGLDRATPDFSTLCRRQKTLNVSLPYRGSTGPLKPLIDSTGIKAEGEGAWNARKHGGSKRRAWRKMQISIVEETLEVRAVEVTDRNIGDAPMLSELLNQIPPYQDIGNVTAPSRAC
jgi:hypothetical protein